jgi:hypothetical protein
MTFISKSRYHDRVVQVKHLTRYSSDAFLALAQQDSFYISGFAVSCLLQF